MTEQHYNECSLGTRPRRWKRGVALGLFTAFLVAGYGAHAASGDTNDGSDAVSASVVGVANTAPADAAPVTAYPTRPDGPPAERIERAKELTKVLWEANPFPEGMRMEADPTWEKNDPVFGEPMKFYPYPGESEVYVLRTNLRDAQGLGDLVLSVQHAGPGPYVIAQNCAEARKLRVLDCVERTGPQGERFVLITDEEPFGARVLHAYAFRPDGTLNTASVRNLVDSHQGKPTRPTPPLDHDQLITIITLPELRP